MKELICNLVSVILVHHSSAILDSNSAILVSKNNLKLECTNNISYCQMKHQMNEKMTKNSEKISRIIGLNALGDKQNAVRITKTGDFKTSHCAGAIQNALYIITAAHCITGLQPEQLLVSARTKSPFEQNRSVVSFESHPDWDPHTFLHDIAILKLNDSLVLTFQAVSPLELGKQNQMNKTVINAWIASSGLAKGFGPNLTYPITSIILTVPIVDHETCANIYQKLGKDVYENQICAGGIKGYGPCTGDGGAPLGFTVSHGEFINKNYAIGILSTYEGCASDVPGIYTDLEKYMDWIVSKTGRQCDFNVYELDSESKKQKLYPKSMYKPKAKLDNNVARTICASMYQLNNIDTIQAPLKGLSSFLVSTLQPNQVVHRPYCITWQWNTCLGCQTFSPKNCKSTTEDVRFDMQIPKLTPRLIGGHDTDPNQLPYQVQVLVDNRYQICHHAVGGVIYNAFYIITSARCIRHNIPCEIKVIAGDDSHGTAQTREVVSVLINEGFVNDKHELNHDIALLKLGSPLNLTEYVNLIPLATQEYPTASVRFGQVSGWRSISLNQPDTYVLQTARVPIIDSCDCRLYYSHQFFKLFSTSKICVGNVGQSPCSDDAGNPVTIQEGNTKYLLGIVSYTRACGIYPVLATKVSAYQEWIVMRAGHQ